MSSTHFGYETVDEDDKARVLDVTAAVTGGAFVAGAFVPDQPGDDFDRGAYLAAAGALAGVVALNGLQSGSGT